jgi:hypothetical protein
MTPLRIPRASADLTQKNAEAYMESPLNFISHLNHQKGWEEGIGIDHLLRLNLTVSHPQNCSANPSKRFVIVVIIVR